MPIQIQVNARNRTCSFEGHDAEAVLHSGLRSGIDLPYECSTGTCGTCKAKLIRGEITEPWDQAPGLKYVKRAQGEFLMCQAVPRTDVVVEVANFVHTMDPGACLPGPIRGVVRESRMLTRDVMFLEVETAHPVEFDAGQFMALAVPGVPGYRGYSMVNFERAATRLQFVVKKKPGGGISEWLFDPAMRVAGTVVDLFGPLGHATFYPGLAQNVLAIAGGSGIAGMMSILARAAQERYFDQHRGDVFFGVRTFADGFFLQELGELAASFPGKLRVAIALSDEPVPDEARARHPTLEFERGLVHEVASRAMKGRYANVRAYLAGPPPAVDAAIRMLIVEAKLTTDNIAYDKFS